MILFELDIPTAPETWLNHESGVYSCVMSHARVEVSDGHGATGYYPAVHEGVKYNIRSVRVNMEYYSRAASLSECRGQEKSFYWDQTNQKIYVHFEDGNPPEIYDNIKLGAVHGYVNGYNDRADGCYFNDMYYPPRLKSVGSLTRKIDNLFAGFMTLNSFTASIINGIKADGTGFFDSFKDEEMFGCAARVLSGEPSDTYDNLTVRAEGFVDEPSWSWDEFQIKVTDKRDVLTRKIPVRTFDKTSYPSLSDDDVGKPIQLVYGLANRVPLTATGTGASGYWDYVICDTTDHAIQSVTAIRTDREGDDGTTTFTYSVTTGILSIAVASGEDEPPNVTADMNGYAVTNALDIIVDILDRYCDIRYTATFYNLTEWAEVQAEAYDLGLVIGKDDTQEIKKIIEDICISSGIGFYPTDDGKYTAKKTDLSATINRTITAAEWYDDPKFSKPRNEYLTSVTVKYGRAWDEDTWQSVDYKAYEADVYKTYSVYQTKSYDTFLTTAADATARAEEIMALSKSIGLTMTRTTGKQHADLDIEDHIYAPYHRAGESELWGEWRVLGKSFDPAKEKTQLTLKWVRAYVPDELIYYYEVDADGNYIADADGKLIIAGL